MKQYYQLDANGFPIDSVAINDGDPVPDGYVLGWGDAQQWYKPQYVNGTWVESLSATEIQQQQDVIIQQLNQLQAQGISITP